MALVLTPCAQPRNLFVKQNRVLHHPTKPEENKPKDPKLLKYWHKRYELFTKFDKGIRMDDVGWYSVTPEAIAMHHARRCTTKIIVDAFAGVGGNAIQFAMTCDEVIAIEKDSCRIAIARHNAHVYGVSHKIKFIQGDFFKLAPYLKADVIFLAPPWGGPSYIHDSLHGFDLHSLPFHPTHLFQTALSIAPNVALFVPRNTKSHQLVQLANLSDRSIGFQIEKNFLGEKHIATTAYYGADFANIHHAEGS